MNYSFVRKNIVFAIFTAFALFYLVSCSGENLTDCLNDVTCEEAILKLKPAVPRTERPRCKNVTLTKEEFEILDDNSLRVTVLNQTFTQWFSSDNNEKILVCVPFTEEFLTCRRWMLNPNEYESRDGGLRIFVPDYNRVYETGEFYFRSGKEAVVCMDTGDSTTDVKGEIVLPLGITWVLSAVSLIVALLLCLFFLRTSYRFLLPFYMINLFVGYVILIVRTFGPVPTSKECNIFGILLQFSFLSAFFWLSVVGFHIWRCVTKITQGIEPTLKHCQMIGYLCYGWGIPFFITFITFLIDAGQLFPESQWLRPEFKSNCWFGSRLPNLLFFYIPMGLVLTANVVFFILSISNIRDATKYYSCKPTISKTKIIGTALHLMVIMGLCWTMDALSWAIAGDPRFWYFTDLLNGLQGFFVLLAVFTDTRLIYKIPYFQKDDKNLSDSSATDVSTVGCEETPEKK